MMMMLHAVGDVGANERDCRSVVRENAGQAQLKTKARLDNVAGVQLPQFDCYKEGADSTS